MSKNNIKKCLTIAGSDCSGGAGIQADLKTFSAHRVFGMSVIVSVVAENTSRVISIYNMNDEIISEQIDAVFEDIGADAVKIGMLPNVSIMKKVAEKLNFYNPQYIVTDPVMVAKGGSALMEPKALDAMKRIIIPLSFILTPNIPEAEALTGIEIRNISDMKKVARIIKDMGAANVLLKGGHLEGDAADILFDGSDFFEYRHKRINTKNTHGTGCTLSSAIAANLANGKSVRSAVENAKNYVTGAIYDSLNIGNGHGPTNHFHEYYKFN